MSASLQIDKLAIGRLARGIRLQRTASRLRRLASGAAVIAGLGLALPGARVARAAEPAAPESTNIDESTFGGIAARALGPATTGGWIAAIEAVPDSPLTI